MTTVTNVYSVVINAQPEAVFNYVSDLTRHPEWSGGQLKIDPVSPGPVAVGSQYISHGEVAVEKNRPNELRVTEYQPPTRFTFVAKDPGFGDVVHEFVFKPEAGGTRMERIVTLNMSPVMAFAFRTFIRPLIGQPMMDKAFAALKSRLEKAST
jgi:uncharacterized protein YndB with AHSA1/START domain